MRSTAQKLVAVALLAAGLGGYLALRHDDMAPSGKDPRQLLGRFWFDRLPKRGEESDAFLFLGGGIGIEDKGSSYRFNIDIFEFERRGSAFDLTWLADKKKQTTTFEIVECHDKPPFDLCLDLKDALRGNKRLRSFARDSDMDANIPWAKDWRASDELRAKTAR